MKPIQRIIILFIVLASMSMFAQDFQGVATYKTKRQVSIKMDSTKMQSAMQEQISEMLKKSFEKTYLLTFNKEASIYKEEEALKAPTAAGLGLVVSSSGGGDVIYKNTKTKTYTNQNDFLGKVFLIQDQLKPLPWELGSETKNIGSYTCFKATITEAVEVTNHTWSTGKIEAKNKTEETETKTKTTTAWYTPQISVSNGPALFYGLPGLILEINDGQQTIICSKIVLNPEDKIDIAEPTKGKKVNAQEFEDITLKKIQEMNERNATSSGKDGETISINIGG
ncbi:MAG: GLPGLI family protein [Psychroserpens sp.]|uniref:GLPGLI family protein n=1 Tax=Psychroserpens sp. TaxID=2020870 RepID=UPI003C86FACC